MYPAIHGRPSLLEHLVNVYVYQLLSRHPLGKEKATGTMAAPGENKEFESWQEALAENELTPQQVAVLQEMVDTGQAESLEAAAQFLDWQESVIDPDEHMYGF